MPPSPEPSKNWPLDAELEILRDGCRRSYRLFALYCYGIARNPEGSWWTPEIHGPWCDWLGEKVLDWEKTYQGKRAPRRHYLMIDAARGFGKTVLVTKGLTLWAILRNPDLATVISSLQQGQSDEFAEVMRHQLEGRDKYCWWLPLYGNWADKRGVWTRQRFITSTRSVVRTEGTVETTSVETGITGRHVSFFILDDPISEEKLREQGKWLRIVEKHLKSIRPALNNNALFIFVGTPYRDGDSLTSEMRNNGVREVCGVPLPPEYESFTRPDGRWDLFHLPARTAQGDVLAPRIWPKNELDSYLEEHPAEAASQVLLRPGSGEAGLLSFERIEDMYIDYEDMPTNLPISIHIDTAFKHQARMGAGDYSCLIVAAHDHDGTVYIPEIRASNRWTVLDFDKHFVEILRKYRRHRIKGITDEREIGGKEGVWLHHLRTIVHEAGLRLPRFLTLSRAGKNKEERIRTAAGFWAAGYIRLINGVKNTSMLAWQMVRIGVSEHDDLADAAADIFIPQLFSPLNKPETQPTAPKYLFEGELQGRDTYQGYVDESPYE